MIMMWLKDFAFYLWFFVLAVAIILISSIVYSKITQTLKPLFIKIQLLWILLKLKIQSLFSKKTPSPLKEYESLGETWIPSESLLMSDLVLPTSEKPLCNPPKAKASKEGTGSRRSTKPKSNPKSQKSKQDTK